MKWRFCFFISVCVTHSLAERLTWVKPNVTRQQRQKPWERSSITVSEDLQSHYQKKHRKMKEITSLKILFTFRKNSVTGKGKRPLLLFIEQIFVGSVISFVFFFPWLIINHKPKCICAKTFETQVSWSLDSCTH